MLATVKRFRVKKILTPRQKAELLHQTIKKRCDKAIKAYQKGKIDKYAALQEIILADHDV